MLLLSSTVLSEPLTISGEVTPSDVEYTLKVDYKNFHREYIVRGRYEVRMDETPGGKVSMLINNKLYELSYPDIGGVVTKNVVLDGTEAEVQKVNDDNVSDNEKSKTFNFFRIMLYFLIILIILPFVIVSGYFGYKIVNKRFNHNDTHKKVNTIDNGDDTGKVLHASQTSDTITEFTEKDKEKMIENIAILMPAYNEQSTIGTTLADLINHGFKNIIVINDGSTDDTKQIVEMFGDEVILLDKEVNEGQGAALRDGMKLVTEHLKHCVYLVTFDADGQHKTSDIFAMLKPLALQGYDITLGSRVLGKTKGMPLRRKLMLILGVIINNFLTGVRLTDAHNGLRAMTDDAARKIVITSPRMEHATEIIDEIKRNELKYKEVPVNITYTKETLKKGHGGWMTAAKVLGATLKRKTVKRHKVMAFKRGGYNAIVRNRS